MRHKFTLIFIIVVALIVLATFIGFTSYTRASVERRRAESRENMATIYQALSAYANDHAHTFPNDPAQMREFLKYISEPQCLVNPSWPDESYIYVSGVRSDSVNAGNAPDTMILLESVPAQKQKQGRLAVTLDGQVHGYSESEFEARLETQQNRWRVEDRRWQLVPLR